MGYNTIFKGELKFKNELSASQLALIRGFLGEDCRDHTGWKNAGGLYYVDLVFLNDYSGLKWDSSAEKTYDLEKIINMITENVKNSIPNFELTGKLSAQGEDIDDRYEIVMVDGFAKVIKIPIVGEKIECPHCEKMFYLEGK